jgi:LuxR family maltose regulon positive regulatory protein
VDPLPALDNGQEPPWPAYRAYVVALRNWIVWMRAIRAPAGPMALPEWRAAVAWAETRAFRRADKDAEIRANLLQARICIAQYRAQGQPALGTLMAYLSEQLRDLDKRGWIELMIDASIVQTTAMQAQGDRQGSLAALERALELAEPGGWMRIFADEGPAMGNLLRQAASRGIKPSYAAKLLRVVDSDPLDLTNEGAWTGGRSASHQPLLVEPLSEREQDVLRYLPTRLTSTDIAQELYVSKNTVRTHIAHIYDKLGVHNRDDAVIRARELGLL